MPAAFVLVMVTDPRSTLWSSTVASAIVPPVASVITPDIEAVSAWPTARVARLNSIEPNRKEHFKSERKDIDRKSTRLNSSHGYISYAVFCLEKKKSPI